MVAKFGLVIAGGILCACSTHHRGVAAPAPTAQADTDSANAAAYVATDDDYLTFGVVEVQYAAALGVVIVPEACIATKLQVGGNNVDVSMNEMLNLTSSPASGAFYSDSTCSHGIKSIFVNMNGAIAYYRDPAAGRATLSVKDAGNLQLTPATLVINVSAATSLAFTQPHGSQLTTWSQASTACGGVAFQVLAGAGPVALPADTDFALTSSSSTGAFYQDSNCAWPITKLTLLAGSYDSESASPLYFRDPTAGTSTLTVAAASLPTVQGGSLATTITP